jgi:hypothetical protein
MNEEKEIKREMGWLIYGIALGGILGLMGNLWASYFMKWLEITYPNSSARARVIHLSNLQS